MAHRKPYESPKVLASRIIERTHRAGLFASAIDMVTAGLAGVSSASHAEVYDFGVRGDGSLGGLLFRYWEPAAQRFSQRFVRVKPDVQVSGRKYLQPVGEKPRFYLIAGTTKTELAEASLPIFISEGEKKALALDRALRQLGQRGLVIGLGGVWAWRCSSKELQPNGKLGKGKSRPIEDFECVNWRGRMVYLMFDSDVTTNWRVQVAETALARELAKRGAQVRIVRIPGVQPWAKSA